MIVIRKGELTNRVSWGCFKAIFEGQGWEICEDEGFMPRKCDNGALMHLPDPDQEEDTQDESDQEDEDESEDEESEEEDDITEKPLSALDLGELKQLAEMRGVNIEGLRSKRDIRTAIREAEEEG